MSTETTKPCSYFDADAIGLFDVRCEQCGKAYGWHGKMADRPPCPGCSHITTVDLTAVEKQLLDGECFCLVQTLLYDYKQHLCETEKVFVLNMYKQNRSKKPYTDRQVSSIKRIYERQMKQPLLTSGTAEQQKANARLAALMALERGLTAREIEFIESVEAQQFPLTGPQNRWIYDIYDRLC